MIVAPAGFVPDSAEINPGLDLVKIWGLEVEIKKINRHNHFAATE